MDGSHASNRPILVTGGAGFIGSNFVLDWIRQESAGVVNLDKLTYAGNLKNLAALAGEPRHTFVRGDICDPQLVLSLLKQHKPWAVVHFAAESHVDRSINNPGEFVLTNVNGTLNLLQQSRTYWDGLDAEQKQSFRFLHVSTDEVYGTLGASDPAFTEDDAVCAEQSLCRFQGGSDHLVRAYHHTFGLPTLTTNCSNNYGPLPVPGEADSADDLECAGRQAAAGLWRRPECSRLALRRATTATRSARCSGAASRARPTTSAAATSRATSTSCARFATCWTSCARRERSASSRS